MSDSEQAAHTLAAQHVIAALKLLDYLPDDVSAEENIAVAIARLNDWLTDEAGRWVK